MQSYSDLAGVRLWGGWAGGGIISGEEKVGCECQGALEGFRLRQQVGLQRGQGELRCWGHPSAGGQGARGEGREPGPLCHVPVSAMHKGCRCPNQ